MAMDRNRETPENTGSTEVGGEHRRPVPTGTTSDGLPDVDRDGRDDRVERAGRADRTDRVHRTDTSDHAHEKFGGMNVGAGFFGWLVAIAMTILLISIVGAIADRRRLRHQRTESDARSQAGTIGIATAIVLLVILRLRLLLSAATSRAACRASTVPARASWCGSSACSSRSSRPCSARSSARSTTCWTGSTCPGSRSRADQAGTGGHHRGRSTSWS